MAMNDEILSVTWDQIQRRKFNGCHPVVFQHSSTCIYVYNKTKKIVKIPIIF